MEHLTINRVGEPKTINYTNKRTGQPDSFQKVGFQTEEHEGRWYDFTFRGSHGLEVGKEYDFETSSREYNGKTYYDAKLAKAADKADEKLELILNRLVGLSMKVDGIMALLQGKQRVAEPEDLPEEEPPF